MATTTTSHMLSCNNMACRTRLSSGRVWVTYCSHIFCDPCGTNLTSTLACTSCRTDLTGKYRLTKKFLKPGIEWKRMVLAGLSPEVIMDISSSAIQFYQHQTCQEVAYLEERIERVRSRVESVKKYYEGVIEQFKKEIIALESKLENSNNSFSMFNNSLGDDIKADLAFPPSLGIGSSWSRESIIGENSWEMKNSSEEDTAGLNFPEESFFNWGHGVSDLGRGDGTRPFKLVRTEINEQNRVEVNGQNMMYMERSSEVDNLNYTRTTTTRSAQSSYSQLPMLLGKTRSATRLNQRGKGSSTTEQLVPYSNIRF